MSIMGMREWFHKNRTIMLVVGALLLLGLLVSYGQFGASAGVSKADYEKAVESARAAYAENSTDPATVQSLASILGEYATFLSKNGEEYENYNPIDQEALKYYDEYFGLMVLESTATYNETPNYANAYMVASYLNQRSTVQANIEGMDGKALADQTNKWMLIAMNHRVDEVNAELAEAPEDSAKLADKANAVAAVAYYENQINSSFDLTPAYSEAIKLLQQAIDNAPEDAKVETLAGYYQSMGSYAHNIDLKTDSEKYYLAALEVAPGNYDSISALTTFYMAEERYDDAINALQSYLDGLAEDDSNRESVEKTINYIIGLRDVANEEAQNPETDGEDEE